MGRQAQLNRFRRWLRDRVERGVAHPEAAESYYRQAKGRRSPEDWQARPRATVAGEMLESIKAEDAKNFRVGMRVSGPPEAFGLPPDGPDLPPTTTCIVTAVDQELGTIMLETAVPARMEKRSAKDWPAPGLYNQNELMKARFPR